MPEPERLYFRQLLSGRDFAVGDMIATQMRNFAYLIGDRATGECLAIDPAYAAQDLVSAAAADDMRVTGVVATHHHPDHIGGTMLGFTLSGVKELLEHTPVPVHVNNEELSWVSQTTGIAESELTGHENGAKLSVGSIELELLHTPGHTPGSQCVLLADRLVSGDTLFLDGCGRTDFPGGDSDALFHSLQRLAGLPGELTVYPGHWYSEEPSAPLQTVRDTNYVMRLKTLQDWHSLMPG